MNEKKINIGLLVILCVTFILSIVSVCVSAATGGTQQQAGSSDPNQTNSQPVEPSWSTNIESSIPEHQHNYVFTRTIPATCSTKGYDVYTCEECNVTETRNETQALGHNYDAQTHICSRCNEIDSQYYTSGLIFDVNADRTAWVVTGYQGGDNEVNIPSEYSTDGGKTYFPVEAISSMAFSDSSITKINISGIKSIEASAFYNCKYLTTVYLNDSIEEINDNAFYGCSSLTEITINKGIKKIGSHAFAYCTSLTTITYNATELTTDLSKEANLFTNSGTSELKLIIGDDVKKIPSYLAYNSRVTEVTISENVEAIGKQAFAECFYLLKINYNAKKLTTQPTAESLIFSTAANSVVVFGDSVIEIPNYLFYACSNLGGVTFGQATTTIGDYSFGKCLSLAEINFTPNLATIGNSSFSECSALSEVIIPDTVTALGEAAFQHCTSLTKISIGLGVSSIPKNLCAECSYLTEITFSENTTTINDGAFKQTGITALDFSQYSALTEIKNQAFAMCRALKEVRFTKYINIYQSCFSQTNIDYIYLENDKLISSANSYSDLGGALASIKKIYVLKSLTEAEDYNPGSRITSFAVTMEETKDDVVYISYHNHSYIDNVCEHCNAIQ